MRIEQRVDDAHLLADGVQAHVQVARGFAHGAPLQHAGHGNAAPEGGPLVALEEHERETRGEQALCELPDASADNAGRNGVEGGDVPGGLAIAIDGFEECAIGGEGELGVLDDDFGQIASAAPAEVSGLGDVDAIDVEVDASCSVAGHPGRARTHIRGRFRKHTHTPLCQAAHEHTQTWVFDAQRTSDCSVLDIITFHASMKCDIT